MHLPHQRASSSPEAGGWLPGSYGVGIGFWPGSRANWRPSAGTPVVYETVSCSARPGARTRSPQGSPGRGDGVAGSGLRSAHPGPATAAMSIATADRTSPHRLTRTPQRPHMCRVIHLRA